MSDDDDGFGEGLVDEEEMTGLGYSEVVPAFVDPNVKAEDLSRAVSFASAASGYDDLKANLTGFPCSNFAKFAVDFLFNMSLNECKGLVDMRRRMIVISGNFS
ncbi:hypothetical protein Sjap_025854 [Stephania japonica]|uniref:Uncharacterized protein n=1 Tax=Stephania japonica TaxID=461633 RepID=A0AAP0E5L5_9MAGN